MTRDEFVVRWRTRSDELARLGAQVDGAKLCGEVLHDFELVCQGEDDAELTLDESAELSGYSADHLRRLARDKKVQAYKRGRRLFFRRGDLPKKPLEVDALRIGGYDPAAQA